MHDLIYNALTKTLFSVFTCTHAQYLILHFSYLFVLLAMASILKCEGFRSRHSSCFSACPILHKEKWANVPHSQIMAREYTDYTQLLVSLQKHFNAGHMPFHDFDVCNLNIKQFFFCCIITALHPVSCNKTFKSIVCCMYKKCCFQSITGVERSLLRHFNVDVVSKN